MYNLSKLSYRNFLFLLLCPHNSCECGNVLTVYTVVQFLNLIQFYISKIKKNKKRQIYSYHECAIKFKCQNCNNISYLFYELYTLRTPLVLPMIVIS